MIIFHRNTGRGTRIELLRRICRAGITMILLVLSILSLSSSTVVRRAAASSIPTVSLWSDLYQSDVIVDDSLVPRTFFSMAVTAWDLPPLDWYDVTLSFNGTLLQVGVFLAGTIFDCRQATDCSIFTTQKPGTLFVSVHNTRQTGNPADGKLIGLVFIVQALGSTPLSLRVNLVSRISQDTFEFLRHDTLDGYFTNTHGRAYNHPAISIISDRDFTPQNGVVRGSGTSEDPYIIEGWEIFAARDWVPVRFPGGTSRASIMIANTTAYTVVRNVRVHDGGYQNLGIVLWNATNVVVESSSVWNGNSGVVLIGARNSRVAYNEFYRNTGEGGVILWGNPSTGFVSSANNITANLIHDSDLGIDLLNATSNTVSGNTVRGAVWAIQAKWSSSGNVITQNHVIDSMVGIQVFRDSNANVITNNRVEITGAPVSVPGFEPLIGISIGRDVNGNLVAYNNVSGLKRGIGLGDASKTLVIYNTIDATQIGVQIKLSSLMNRIGGNIITAPVGIQICTTGTVLLGPPANNLSSSDRRIEHCPAFQV